MSLAGPAGLPSACSGDMNPGEPATQPVRVSPEASTRWEIPKSMIRADELDRHQSPAGRPAQEHLTHSAVPQPAQQPVSADLTRI